MNPENPEPKAISHLAVPEAVELLAFEGGERPALRSRGQGSVLGLDHSAQRKRLQRTPWATGAIMAPVGADGRRREMYCRRAEPDS